MAENQDKKPKEISKLKFALTIFVTYFFRSFIFLTVPALICLIFGAFRKELLIVGGVLLALDLFITIFFTVKTVRLKGSHEMFNAIVNAANYEDSLDDSYDAFSKPDKDDLYSEKAHELRREASSVKSVREVFELYKKDIADMALTDETYTVYIKKEKYFCVSFRAMQVPRATALSGSSATWKGMFILSEKRAARPRSKAPPPASQIPSATMSE